MIVQFINYEHDSQGRFAPTYGEGSADQAYDAAGAKGAAIVEPATASTPGIEVGGNWPCYDANPGQTYQAPIGNITLPSGRDVSIASTSGDSYQGEYHGSTGMTDRMTGERVGSISYTLTPDELHIDYIESNAPGEKVADTLLAYTLADVPAGTAVNPGMMTPEGSHWWDSVAPKLADAGYLPVINEPLVASAYDVARSGAAVFVSPSSD